MKSSPRSKSKLLSVIYIYSPEQAEAKKNLMSLMQEAVPSPAQPGFFMAGLALKGKGSAEEEKFRQYLKQLKEECTLRLF